MFVAVVIVATSFNFFLPRFTGQDPIATRLELLAAEGETIRAEDYKALIETYNAKFGLDRPLVLQYLTYLSTAVRFDFGNSITKYPVRVSELVNQAMPWSIGLLVTSTLLAFVVGTLGGAVLAWQHGPKAAFELILPPFFSARRRPVLSLRSDIDLAVGFSGQGSAAGRWLCAYYAS